MAKRKSPPGGSPVYLRMGRSLTQAAHSLWGAEEEEALTELQNAAFGDTWGFCPNTVEEISASVRLDRSDPRGIILVIENGDPVAYCWTTRAGNIGWISMAGARPDHRGKGVGRSAVVAGMAYLEDTGVDGVELEVAAENPPARELYLKLGFRKMSETVWYEKRLR